MFVVDTNFHANVLLVVKVSAGHCLITYSTDRHEALLTNIKLSKIVSGHHGKHYLIFACISDEDKKFYNKHLAANENPNTILDFPDISLPSSGYSSIGGNRDIITGGNNEITPSEGTSGTNIQPIA
jgi:hypothetical protein